MNRTELITAMSEEANITKKDAGNALTALTEIIAEELKKGEKIQLIGFGTFDVLNRPEREGRNPQTGKITKIAAKKVPKFKAGKALKESLN